jgi:hypothetical protein
MQKLCANPDCCHDIESHVEPCVCGWDACDYNGACVECACEGFEYEREYEQ